MKLLIFNCGSSSLSFKLFSGNSSSVPKILLQGKAHRVGVIGTEESFIELNHAEQHTVVPIQLDHHALAAGQIIQMLQNLEIQFDGIGHRIVHGGPYFNASTLITPQTSLLLEKCLPLAPIHNPNASSVISVCQQAYPDLPQYLTFDTTFFSQMPDTAALEMLPQSFTNHHAVRHYGFHGLSYTYILQHISHTLNLDLAPLKIIACHLGTGGSSITAIQNGKPVDTSMGFTPLQGLVMSTRCGDLDPFLPLYLMQVHNHSASELNQLLNKESGLLGLSGFSSDIRDLLKAANEQLDPNAQAAIDLLIHRLKKFIGAYAVLLGGLDLLVFTDDIGLQNPAIRQLTCTAMDWFGIELDEQKNLHAPLDALSEIQTDKSAVRILVLPTDEESIIAMDGFTLLQEVKRADL